MGVLCANPNSQISAYLEIEFNISRDFFLVLSPATVYVYKAGIFYFLHF